MAKLRKMTEGNIFKHLLFYAIPLIIGNFFQLAYNMVDSIIVGRFIGKNALATVGASTPVNNLIIYAVSGLCIGAAVLMSEAFGAQENSKVKKIMANISIFGIFVSIIVTLLGVIFARHILVFTQTPAEILDMGTVYLQFIFAGLPFTFFYNALSMSLRSIGDTKASLKILVITSIFNGVSDVILIGYFGFGLVCSALTTVIAQGISVVLCCAYIYANIPELQLKWKDFVLDLPILKQTLRYGGITALQQSCQPIGKVLIQGVINTLGVDIIATYNIVTKVDDYAFIPEQNIANSITTFVAQNKGAKKNERAHKGFQLGIIMEVVYWVFICIITLTFREQFIKIFVSGPELNEILKHGLEYLGIMAFFYVFPAFTNGIQGFFRGVGNMKMALVGTVIQTVFRVIGTFTFAPKFGIVGIALSMAFGWVAMLIVHIPYYWFRYGKNKLID
jgi:putative efflux protein, MATE family